MTKLWVPLEGNPEVFNSFLHKCGVDSNWGFSEIYGTGADLLAMIPRPSLAVVLLFPITEKTEALRRAQDEAADEELGARTLFLRQFVGNACGTIGLIHAVGNCGSRLPLVKDGFFEGFLAKAKALTPEERGKLLEEDDEIEHIHEEAAQEGQTEAPEAHDDVNYHFIAFVNIDGQVTELDGRKRAPVPHGPTTDDTFLEDACAVVQRVFMSDTDDLHFFSMSLGPID
jgi:ubiquitin carboxyl-terminal hydrolase L3